LSEEGCEKKPNARGDVGVAEERNLSGKGAGEGGEKWVQGGRLAGDLHLMGGERESRNLEIPDQRRKARGRGYEA